MSGHVETISIKTWNEINRKLCFIASMSGKYTPKKGNLDLGDILLDLFY